MTSIKVGRSNGHCCPPDIKNFGIRDDSTDVLVVLLISDPVRNAKVWFIKRVCANVGGYCPKVNDVLGIINGEVVSLENIAEVNDTDAIKKVYTAALFCYRLLCSVLPLIYRCTKYPVKTSALFHLWRTQ